MRRTFASEQDFLDWHEQAKSAAGLPRVGVNARTGEPQPDKQQTTDYTTLGRDEDGDLILEATVGDERLAARGLTDGLIREDLLTADEIAALASAYPAWEPDGTYALDVLREHDGVLYRCVQPHENRDPSHTPDTTPALWVEAAAEGVVPEWTQPTGAQDAYAVDDLVTHPDRADTMGTGTDTIWVWQSKIDANTTEPGQDGDSHRYWEPVEEV